MGNLTKLITEWQAGEKAAEGELLKLVYPAMRAIASKQLRFQQQWTLRPTELANDVFMKLRSEVDVEFSDSIQLYGLVARMIRFEIVDHIRQRSSKKRGSDFSFVNLEHAAGLSSPQMQNPDWLALDHALTQLESENQRHAALVELRYFMGLSIKETAAVMQISTATADRMWSFARAFLADRMLKFDAGKSLHPVND